MKTAVDFSNDVTYTVTITVELTNREVLEILYNANPGNALSWHLQDEDISNWEGVSSDNGVVTELNFEDRDLNTLPVSIKYLTSLVRL